ncbi:MAG: SLC13 family permease, partial [Acidobacteria bacterium]|nr:SLC13 family permease [Acidobacteriota bacterium]
MTNPQQFPAILVFAFTFTVIAIGRLPGLRLDRTGAAIIGASLMLGAGVLSVDEAWRAIRYETIILLFGMMIVVANLRFAGFFPLVAQWAVRRASAPTALLTAIVLISAVLSALFVNDTICSVMTPLVVEITRSLRRRPLPYLLAVATASNIGSAATITGNPQNMMIGGFSGVPFALFFAKLAPVALFGVVVAIVLSRWFHREEFADRSQVHVPEQTFPVDRMLLGKSLLAAGILFGSFFAGAPIAVAALVAGAALLITRRVHPEEVYAQIDWSLLVRFSGPFIILAGVEKTSLDEELFSFAARFHLEQIPVLSLASVLLSNAVSNVPSVMLFKPVIQRL